MARPSPSQIPFTSAGEPSKVRRSFSKISTPSNPTAAATCSFSGKEPLRQTVAMALGRGVNGVAITIICPDPLGATPKHRRPRPCPSVRRRPFRPLPRSNLRQPHHPARFRGLLDRQGRLQRPRPTAAVQDRLRLAADDLAEVAHLQRERVLLRHDAPLRLDRRPPAVAAMAPDIQARNGERASGASEKVAELVGLWVSVPSAPLAKCRIIATVSSTGKPRAALDSAAWMATMSPQMLRRSSMTWIRLISTMPPPGSRRQEPEPLK